MEDKERTEEKPKFKTHPRKTANILSVIFFCWTLPFFVKGFKRDITEDDLFGPLKAHKSIIAGDSLEATWTNEKKSKKEPSLWKVLIKEYGSRMALSGLILLIQEVIIKMGQPLLIGKLLAFYTPGQTTTTKETAYLYASGIIGISLLNIIIAHSYFFGLQQFGLKIRVALCSLIYRKALKLSRRAMIDTTVGQVVNIMSNDVNRFDFFVIQAQHLFVAPIETLVVVYLLYITLSPAALAGIALLLASVPLQMYLGKRTSVYRMRTALRTDKRVRLMNEIINGIQVIKMYTWEKPFAKLVELARRMEMKQITASSYLKAINVSFMLFLNRAAIFACILTYILTGNALNAEFVYVTASFYGILRQTLTMFLPRAITILAETNVSVKRIEKFLKSDEIDWSQDNEFAAINNEKSKTVDKNGYMDKSISSEKVQIGVNLNNICVKWVKSSDDYTLTDINFVTENRQTVAIVGPVGSGKTTLLNVILKEIPISSGTLKIDGKISYASQEPWLFAASVRQNILFGESLEMERYKRVVKACALERDFSLFPYGDKTIVGERGVTLSGGQRARINLARAVYKDADIYLLDDPLSAVDTHVGQQLFDDCITTFLRDKCTILVTHQLQYLKTVDKIYLLEKGTVTASGTYDELRNSGGDFVNLLTQEEVESDEGEETLSEKDVNLRKSRSTKSLEEKSELPTEVKEQRTVGSISKKIYLKYMKASGSYIYPFLVFILFVICQSLGSGSELFLTFWVNLEQDKLARTLNKTSNNETTLQEQEDNTFFTTQVCIYIYTSLVITIIVLTITRSLSFFKVCMKASQILHNNMFSNIVYTTMRFFNTNPSGRILNRFAKDVGSIDEVLPQTIIDTFQVGLTVFAITAVLSTINPWILLPTVIIFAIFYWYKIVFITTSRNLKRIEGRTRSPVFSHLTASLQGLATIRAFSAEEILRKEFDDHQDLHSSAFYMFMACSRTFALWLDLNCLIYIGLVILSFLFIGTETYGANVGLAITQSITLTGMLQWGIRQWSELENQMTSVERVVEYTELTKEPDNGRNKPSKDWPSKADVVFENLSLRYSPDDAFVLKNINFQILDRQKIGVVGRTGAGKSSLISAFFRLCDIEGDIFIDGVNTKTISLEDLRSKLSIIPQEPVLFSGTLRNNLDPFDEYTDAVLWNALDEVSLKSEINNLPQGLHSNVAEGGSNFSVGQRQLLCLARAIVRSNKILILDEATANIDAQTDELIQNTIRKKFAECTVLTIAHRLHTVMDSNKILVMDAGCVAEFDHPYVLLQNPEGVFYQLVQQTGKGMTESLTKIAEQNYIALRDLVN